MSPRRFPQGFLREPCGNWPVHASSVNPSCALQSPKAKSHRAFNSVAFFVADEVVGESAIDRPGGVTRASSLEMQDWRASTRAVARFFGLSLGRAATFAKSSWWQFPLVDKDRQLVLAAHGHLNPERVGLVADTEIGLRWIVTPNSRS